MTEEVLRVEHLNKFYGKHQTLFDINFSLNKGEVLTLLGPSGSGKSTLLRTLNGLEEYEDGAIYFHGKRLILVQRNGNYCGRRLAWFFRVMICSQI